MMNEMRDDPHVTWFMRRFMARPPGMPLEALLHELVDRIRAECRVKQPPEPEMTISPFPKTRAGRFELLMDLHAPMVEREDGTFERDPSVGIISAEQLRMILDGK